MIHSFYYLLRKFFHRVAITPATLLTTDSSCQAGWCGLEGCWVTAFLILVPDQQKLVYTFLWKCSFERILSIKWLFLTPDIANRTLVSDEHSLLGLLLRLALHRAALYPGNSKSAWWCLLPGPVAMDSTSHVQTQQQPFSRDCQNHPLGWQLPGDDTQS